MTGKARRARQTRKENTRNVTFLSVRFEKILKGHTLEKSDLEFRGEIIFRKKKNTTRVRIEELAQECLLNQTGLTHRNLNYRNVVKHKFCGKT